MAFGSTSRHRMARLMGPRPGRRHVVLPGSSSTTPGAHCLPYMLWPTWLISQCDCRQHQLHKACARGGNGNQFSWEAKHVQQRQTDQNPGKDTPAKRKPPHRVREIYSDKPLPEFQGDGITSMRISDDRQLQNSGKVESSSFARSPEPLKNRAGCSHIHPVTNPLSQFPYCAEMDH